MTETGAFLNGLGTVPGGIDPVFSLIVGMVLGVCATLSFLKWTPGKKRQADPLSSLFKSETLDEQLTRVGDPEARFERKDRAASAIRAKMFARQSQRAAAQRKSRPHYAERYDHAAVLNHIAKVMRADTHEQEPDEKRVKTSSEWEEVLMLPPPPKDEDGMANAA
ncbi:MAG: hypothetical protein AAFY42_06740 [Pseudomonadota bacterium]